jgi:hypothetical protein
MKIYLCWDDVWLFGSLDGDGGGGKKVMIQFSLRSLLMCFLTQSGGKLEERREKF